MADVSSCAMSGCLGAILGGFGGHLVHLGGILCHVGAIFGELGDYLAQLGLTQRMRNEECSFFTSFINVFEGASGQHI